MAAAPAVAIARALSPRQALFYRVSWRRGEPAADAARKLMTSALFTLGSASPFRAGIRDLNRTGTPVQ